MKNAVILIRSLIFNIFLIIWTGILSITCFMFLFLPVSWLMKLGRFWSKGIQVALYIICDLKIEIRGRDKIPDAPCIIASKHQSALETLLFYLLCKSPVFILKKELLKIPLFGPYIKKSRAIAVDRKAGAKALRDMVTQALERLNENRQVIIFPEGTRVRIGETRRYQPGIAAIYLKANVPVFPLALNTGLFWEKNSFIRKPGRAILEFREPITPGLTREEFIKILEERIEHGTKLLLK